MANVPVPQLASDGDTAAEIEALLTAVPLSVTTRFTGVRAKTGAAVPPGVTVTDVPSDLAPLRLAPAGELSVPHDPATA
jgi:hypothetical protein